MLARVPGIESVLVGDQVSYRQNPVLTFQCPPLYEHHHVTYQLFLYQWEIACALACTPNHSLHVVMQQPQATRQQTLESLQSC